MNLLPIAKSSVPWPLHGSWASGCSGECAKNPGYMLRHCAATCRARDAAAGGGGALAANTSAQAAAAAGGKPPASNIYAPAAAAAPQGKASKPAAAKPAAAKPAGEPVSLTFMTFAKFDSTDAQVTVTGL